jgi:hypothetical protein
MRPGALYTDTKAHGYFTAVQQLPVPSSSAIASIDLWLDAATLCNTKQVPAIFRMGSFFLLGCRVGKSSVQQHIYIYIYIYI